MDFDAVPSDDIVDLRRLEVQWSSDRLTTVVRLAGRLDAGAVDVVRRITAVAAAAPGLHVDLAGVRFVDVTALELVEELAKNPAIVIDDASPAIAAVLP